MLPGEDLLCECSSNEKLLFCPAGLLGDLGEKAAGAETVGNINPVDSEFQFQRVVRQHHRRKDGNFDVQMRKFGRCNRVGGKTRVVQSGGNGHSADHFYERSVCFKLADAAAKL